MKTSLSLSKKIEELRRKTGYKQAYFAEKWGVQQSIISKLESGPVKINEDLYLKILETLKEHNIDIETLVEPNFLRIGFGHSIWASPIILSLHNPDSISYKAYSFGKFKDKEIIPIYNKFGEKFGRKLEIGENAYFNSDTNFERTDITPSEIKLKPFNADELLKQYNIANDLVLIPTNIVENRNNDFFKILSIVYTANGSTTVTFISPQNHENFKRLSLEEIIKNQTQINLFYEEGTIADFHLREHINPLLANIKENSDLSVKYIACDTSNTNELLGKIEDKLKDDECCLVLSWHPNSFWLKKAFEQESPEYCIIEKDLIRELNRNGNSNKIYFEFALYVKSDRKTEIFENSNMLKDLIKSLEHSVNVLNINKINERSVYIEQIARYLNMGVESCRLALENINFVLHPSCEFLTYILNKKNNQS